MTKVFTPELVDAAVAKHGRGELRRRLLPARLVVYFVRALCLFARESYEEVIRMLTSGIPGSRVLAQVNRSSLCRARVRLGEGVLERVSGRWPARWRSRRRRARGGAVCASWRWTAHSSTCRTR
ncbi:transposase domain-containing protein [Streptomyces sp. NPDC005122]